MVTYAVIPAAGLGTRVSPAGKAIPKELFPVPYRFREKVFLFPILHLIFNRLFEAGVRNFYIVTSPRKNMLTDYFTPDYDYLSFLVESGKLNEANVLERFYNNVKSCKIEFVLQEEALGVGDAVFRAWRHVGNNSFLISMGDMLLIGERSDPYKKLIEVFYGTGADASLLVEKVYDPQHYGVVIGKRVNKNIYQVERIIEKPKEYVSNLAVLGVYCVKPELFQVMKRLNEADHWELPDSIQELVNLGKKVIAYKMENNLLKYDVGRVETYMDIYKRLGGKSL